MYVRRKFKKIQENWVFHPFFPILQGKKFLESEFSVIFGF